MKNFVQEGDRLNHTAAADISSGTCVAVGDRVGVACTDIANGASGVLAMEGVFNLPKTSTDTIAQGVKVYLDVSAGEITTTATDNILAGYAFAAAANGATTVDVNINK